jgi:hypothetical protein
MTGPLTITVRNLIANGTLIIGPRELIGLYPKS